MGKYVIQNVSKACRYPFLGMQGHWDVNGKSRKSRSGKYFCARGGVGKAFEEAIGVIRADNPDTNPEDTRKELIRVALCLCDEDNDGVLKSAELQDLATAMIEIGSGSDDLWTLSYPEMCAGFGANPEDGISLEMFMERVLEDNQISNEQLENLGCTIESMELQSYKTNCRKPVNNSHKLVVALDHEPL